MVRRATGARLDEPALKAIAGATGGLYAPLGAEGQGFETIYKQALAPMLKHDLASRGPRYVAKSGVIALAQLTGMPVVAVSFNPQWKISLKSWDRFQIPLPFSRCEMIFEKPFYVPREASETEREMFRQQLDQALNGITVD